jgi:glycosyltransferase involved in cell wall biosynthesis
MPKLSIIMSCYFNGPNIPVTTKRLIDNEKNFPAGTDIEYIVIDDGSKDDTFEQLCIFQKQYPDKVKVIKLAANVGSYNALLAGMAHATGDCCSIVAADLQDPPELIPSMLEHWNRGYKLVIGQRENREDPLFDKLFSNVFNSLIRKFALPGIPKGGFDFVLFDRQLKEEVVKMNEGNSNCMYLLAWQGFPYVSIPYTRQKREIGKSRWTFKKKIKLFIDSFVSFSFFPVRLISVAGIILGFLAILYASFILIARLTGQINVQGWSTMMIVFLFVSSFQMIALGIIGEYVWRNLDASRKRPNYIIDTIVGNGKKAN